MPKTIALLLFSLTVFAANHQTVETLHPTVRYLAPTTDDGPVSSNGYLFWITRENKQPTLHITAAADKQSFDCKLWTLPKGTQLYHWTTKGAADAIAADGGISSEKFDSDLAKEISTGKEFQTSEGFYVSLDPVDSIGYGTDLLISTVQQDVTLVDPHVCAPKWDHDAFERLRIKVGPDVYHSLGIVGCRQSNNLNWIVLTDGRSTAKIIHATARDLYNDKTIGRRARTPSEFIALDQKHLLVSNPWITKNNPAIAHLLTGTPVSDEDRAYLSHEMGCAVFSYLGKNTEDWRPDLAMGLLDPMSDLGKRLANEGYLNALQEGMARRLANWEQIQEKPPDFETEGVRKIRSSHGPVPRYYDETLQKIANNTFDASLCIDDTAQWGKEP